MAESPITQACTTAGGGVASRSWRPSVRNDEATGRCGLSDVGFLTCRRSSVSRQARVFRAMSRVMPAAPYGPSSAAHGACGNRIGSEICVVRRAVGIASLRAMCQWPGKGEGALLDAAWPGPQHPPSDGAVTLCLSYLRRRLNSPPWRANSMPDSLQGLYMARHLPELKM
jgi:hypothetical protein